jgi:hypothetical protein
LPTVLTAILIWVLYRKLNLAKTNCSTNAALESDYSHQFIQAVGLNEIFSWIPSNQLGQSERKGLRMAVSFRKKITKLPAKLKFNGIKRKA